MVTAHNIIVRQVANRSLDFQVLLFSSVKLCCKSQNLSKYKNTGKGKIK